MHGVVEVYDYASAVLAINTIVKQGEGTSITDIFSSGSNLSHFHSFLQLLIKRRINGVIEIVTDTNNDIIDSKENFEPQFRFTIGTAQKGNVMQANLNNKPLENVQQHVEFRYELGSPINLDIDDIITDGWDYAYNNPSNDKTKENLNIVNFNANYGRLLNSLQQLFNYDSLKYKQSKKEILQNAIALMRQIQMSFTQSIAPGTYYADKKYTPPPFAPNFDPPVDMIPFLYKN